MTATMDYKPVVHQTARLLCTDLDTTEAAVEENASLTASVGILHHCC